MNEPKRHAIALVTALLDYQYGATPEAYSDLLGEAGMSVNKYDIIEELSGFVGAAIVGLAAHTDRPILAGYGQPSPTGLLRSRTTRTRKARHE